MTITIKGTWVASTDDLPGGITLQGAPGATLQAPKATTDPVLGISGTGVELNNLTISGGVNALRGRSGSAFTGTDLVIEKASGDDVLLNHSVVTLNTSTIENFGFYGISTNWDSTVFLNGGTVQKNAGDGIFASSDASDDIYGGAVLQDNAMSGVAVDSGTIVEISAASVTGNKGAGVHVHTGGHAHVTGSTSNISNNDINGIFAGGTAMIEGGATIANNSAFDVYVGSGNAKLRDVLVQGNGEGGIYTGNATLQIGEVGSTRWGRSRYRVTRATVSTWGTTALPSLAIRATKSSTTRAGGFSAPARRRTR